MSPRSCRCQTVLLPVRDYDLDATMDSGQVFHFAAVGGGWEGVVGRDWVRLGKEREAISVSFVARDAPERSQLLERVARFLQTNVDLSRIVATFPNDGVMERAVQVCRGLRLLKQEPWQCLASFILSSTKQILQIRQICAVLSERHGPAVDAESVVARWHGFPSAEQIARLDEKDLRACKAGFRAPYLLGAARLVAEGKLDLGGLDEVPIAEARSRMMEVRGVGRKIADCALLFTGSHAGAFPVDVWVARALRELYFRGREMPLRELEHFASEHFGPHGGYAQQYLFHYVRVHGLKPQAARRTSTRPP